MKHQQRRKQNNACRKKKVKKVPVQKFTNISKLMETKQLKLKKIVQDVEKEYTCQNIKIETHVENVD